jgi:hypothetical protein
MKKYDYDLAKKIVNKLSDLGVLMEASMGMHSDWFWTARTIWEDGKWQVDLMQNNQADKMYEEFVEARKNGLSMFLDTKDEHGFYEINPEYEKYDKCLFGGLRGSGWDTPVLSVELTDGTEKTFNCYIGNHDADNFINNYMMGMQATSGCISSEVRSQRESSINIEDFNHGKSN